MSLLAQRGRRCPWATSLSLIVSRSGSVNWVMKPKPKIVRVDASPLQLEVMLEQAKVELDRGEPRRARAYVTSALDRLQTALGQQDAVLDELVQQPEVRAVRVTEPLYTDPRDER
jgi:hypothetical protein